MNKSSTFMVHVGALDYGYNLHGEVVSFISENAPAHTVALLRRRNGAVAATYDDAPFGAVTETVPADSAVPANPFQWSSEVYDSELDLVYYNYRHYSPSDGRWLSRDPIEENGGVNLYGFVGNRVFASLDLFGLWGDGRKYGPDRNPNGCLGHSDFCRSDEFDYTLEDHSITHPFNPFFTGNHFQDSDESLSQIKTAVDTCNKEKFERAMHRMQDFWSHYNKGYRYNPGSALLRIGGCTGIGAGIGSFFPGLGTAIGGAVGAVIGCFCSADDLGHIKVGTTPDEDDDEWKNAEKQTIKSLEEWDENCCKCGDKWNVRKIGPCDKKSTSSN